MGIKGNRIVECVPNFSEGRNMDIINAITKEIEETEDVVLLDVDPGADTNRTVVTFVGSPEGVKEAAFKAIKKASELIDMRNHKGAHPRMGATDVCPFVPVSGVNMNDCIEIAKDVGKKVAEQLNIPVYLYEEAATRPERKDLSNVRKGEYEGLPEKLKDPEWAPDFGKPIFNPRSGASIIGAREFLIAYNLNLNTRDKKRANKVAFTIRERGKLNKNAEGNKVRIPGLLKAVKAIGWYIPEYGFAQISVNLINYKITPLWKLFEVASEEADKIGLRVTGSELVGLIPKEAMIQAGRHFLDKQGKCSGVPEEELIHIAVLSMGMDQIAPFRPEEKIIEYRIAKPRILSGMGINKFIDDLSSDSPAPGGGSVAALLGSLSSALSSMVANLTYGKKGYEDAYSVMNDIAIKLQEIKDEFLNLMDEDTEAFNKVMDAFRLPRKTEEEKIEREKIIEEATKGATLIPLETLRLTKEIIPLIEVAAKKGNKNSISDAGVSAISAIGAAESAYLNIIINLKSIKDQSFVAKIKKEANEHLEYVRKEAEKIKNGVMEKLKKDL